MQKTMKASVLQVELSTTSSMAGRSATAIRLISSLVVTLSSSLQAANIAVLLTWNSWTVKQRSLRSLSTRAMTVWCRASNIPVSQELLLSLPMVACICTSSLLPTLVTLQLRRTNSDIMSASQATAATSSLCSILPMQTAALLSAHVSSCQTEHTTSVRLRWPLFLETISLSSVRAWTRPSSRMLRMWRTRESEQQRLSMLQERIYIYRTWLFRTHLTTTVLVLPVVRFVCRTRVTEPSARMWRCFLIRIHTIATTMEVSIIGKTQKSMVLLTSSAVVVMYIIIGVSSLLRNVVPMVRVVVL